LGREIGEKTLVDLSELGGGRVLLGLLECLITFFCSILSILKMAAPFFELGAAHLLLHIHDQHHLLGGVEGEGVEEGHHRVGQHLFTAAHDLRRLHPGVPPAQASLPEMRARWLFGASCSLFDSSCSLLTPLGLLVLRLPLLHSLGLGVLRGRLALLFRKSLATLARRGLGGSDLLIGTGLYRIMALLGFRPLVLIPAADRLFPDRTALLLLAALVSRGGAGLGKLVD